MSTLPILRLMRGACLAVKRPQGNMERMADYYEDSLKAKELFNYYCTPDNILALIALYEALEPEGPPSTEPDLSSLLTKAELTLEDMKVGSRYNWKNQKERLIYLGKKGSWHQFEKLGDPGRVWCEILDEDLHYLEETVS